MSEEKVRVRFAPSPTGLLHVGNARTALFNWLFARQMQGTFILRIEDTDVERSLREYEDKLIQDLQWLGLDWDEGPDVGGDCGPYRQSARLDIYTSYMQQLLENNQAYYCFCTQEDLEQERQEALAQGKTPVYKGKCRNLSPNQAIQQVEAGKKATVRLRTPGKGTFNFSDMVRGELNFDLSLVGDPILVRRNGLPAYNYVVVVDDFLMQISHVIRGEDHLANTVRQILTFQALELAPPLYAHLSMVMGKDNARLSKRHGATAVDQFEKNGILAAALLNYLALLGWAPPDGQEVLSSNELTRLFDLHKVSRSAAIFDYDKLYWLNRQYIKRLPSREKAEQAAAHLAKAGFLPGELTDSHWLWLEQAVESLSERVDTFSEIVESFSMLFDFSFEALGEDEREYLRTDCSDKVIRAFAEKLFAVEDFSYEAFAAMTQEIKAETGCKGKDLFHPLRVALTARASGLDLDRFIPLVESGSKLFFPTPLLSCRDRVAKALEFLE